MKRRRQERIKRQKPRRKKPLTVLLHGFGDNHGKPVKVGIVKKLGPCVAVIQLEDEEGRYEERYSLHSGIRVEDIGCPDGWSLSLKDLHATTRSVRATPLGTSRIMSVYEEDIPLSDHETLQWRMYRDSKTRDLYVKVSRLKAELGADGEPIKSKEYPGLVPLTTLKGLIERFEAQ